LTFVEQGIMRPSPLSETLTDSCEVLTKCQSSPASEVVDTCAPGAPLVYRSRPLAGARLAGSPSPGVSARGPGRGLWAGPSITAPSGRFRDVHSRRQAPSNGVPFSFQPGIGTFRPRRRLPIARRAIFHRPAEALVPVFPYPVSGTPATPQAGSHGQQAPPPPGKPRPPSPKRLSYRKSYNAVH